MGSQAVISRHDWRRAILRSRLLPAGTKVAALVICEFANSESGEAFPSYATIADAGGMEPEGVRSAVKRLAVAGFLRVRKQGFRGTNRMTLALPLDEQQVTSPVQPARNDANPVPSPRIGQRNPGSSAQIGNPNPVSPQRTIRAGHNGQSGVAATGNLYSNQNYNPSLPSPPAPEAPVPDEGPPQQGPRESARDFNRRRLAYYFQRGSGPEDLPLHILPKGLGGKSR